MDDYKSQARVFKAFCDETRLQILALLQTGEKCACVLLEEVSVCQSTLSHHMKILVESGIVDARKAGKWTYYTINETGSQTAIQMLSHLTAVAHTATAGKTCC